MIFRDGIASFSLSFTYFLLIFWRNLVETHLWARVWAREVPGLLWFSSALSLQWIFGQFAYYEPCFYFTKFHSLLTIRPCSRWQTNIFSQNNTKATQKNLYCAHLLTTIESFTAVLFWYNALIGKSIKHPIHFDTRYFFVVYSVLSWLTQQSSCQVVCYWDGFGKVCLL